MKTIIVAVMSCALSLAGCASTPDISVGYYLPKSSPSLRVVRTVACDDSGRITVLSSVAPATNLMADTDKRETVSLKKLDGAFANAELGLVLLEDGRLSGLNSSQSGQGSEIIKAAVQVVSSIVPGGGVLKLAADKSGFKALAPSSPPKEEPPTVCDDIRKAAGEEAGVALVFENQGDLFSSAARTGNLLPVLESQQHYKDFGSKVMGLPCIESEAIIAPKAPIEAGDIDEKKFLKLKLRQPAYGKVTVRVAKLSVSNNKPTLSACNEKLWSGGFTLPQYGTEYDAPIPRAVAFGKSSVSLGLSDSGALTGVKYGKDNGLASGLTSASDAYASLVRTSADQTAQDEAAADAIAQHQRLLLCRNDPAACET